MREVQVERVPGDAAELAGHRLTADAVDVEIREDADVWKDDGTLLARFRKKVLPPGEARLAYEGLRPAAGLSQNRGIAAGIVPSPDEQVPQQRRQTEIEGGDRATRHSLTKLDGSRSATTISTNSAVSGVVGFYDRYARNPFCRTTAFSARHPELYSQAVPYLRSVSEEFRRLHEERWATQRAICDATEPDWIIPGTVFTTITVNKNWQTAVHQDKGDYAAGFGVMTAFDVGDYDGALLAFPGFSPVVGIDMRACDILLADVHEWHGNTPFVGRVPYERLSLVCYYREKMQHCRDREAELDWARNRGAGTPLQGE